MRHFLQKYPGVDQIQLTTSETQIAVTDCQCPSCAHLSETDRFNRFIAEAYAGSNIGDAFDNHAAYWVAVDYLRTAASLDPSLREEADAKIKAYSRLFPTREEGFYRGITDEGIVYRVGGWIGEITRVWFRKE